MNRRPISLPLDDAAARLLDDLVAAGLTQSQATTARTGRVLVDELQLGLRDAGELRGLSHQRVQRLIRS